jgi:hypothetical protein
MNVKYKTQTQSLVQFGLKSFHIFSGELGIKSIHLFLFLIQN